MTELKKDPYDRTSGKRAAAHLERLAESKGKRLPVDLNAGHIAQLDDLVRSGYGSSAASVIRRAIEEAHAMLQKTA